MASEINKGKDNSGKSCSWINKLWKGKILGVFGVMNESNEQKPRPFTLDPKKTK